MEELQKAVKELQEYLNSPYIHSVVKAAEEVFSALVQEILKEHKMPEEDTFITHYTSIEVLVSMLNRYVSYKNSANQNKERISLRLYDTIHFNDPDEGNYIYRKFEDNFKRTYPWFAKNEEVPHHAYIASFILSDKSKKMEDNLVFWRTYGKEGEGCSLLIPVKKDSETTSLHSNLRKVFYGKGKKDVKEAFTKLSPILKKLGPLIDHQGAPEIDEVLQKKLRNAFWQPLEDIRYLYKSEAYAYESECRYIDSNPNNGAKPVYEYQEQNKSPLRIRHYLELEDLAIENLLITDSSITLGPCVPYRENVRDCIEKLLEEAGLGGPKVIHSKITYRKS